MDDLQSLKPELSALAPMLAQSRFPQQLQLTLAANPWLVDQIPWEAQVASRSPWTGAFAAASLAAGLISTQPAWALSSDQSVPSVPPPPLVAQAGAGAQQAADLQAPPLPPPVPEVAPPTAAEVQKGDSDRTNEAAAQPTQAAAAQEAAPAPATGASSETPSTAVDLPFASRTAHQSNHHYHHHHHHHHRTTSMHKAAAGHKAGTSRQAKAGPKPAHSQKATSDSLPATAEISAKQGAERYVIKVGDTLIKLARRYFHNNGAHWRGIFAVNRDKIRNPHDIFPGQDILIPSLAEAIAAERGSTPLAGSAVSHRQRVAAVTTHRHHVRHKTRLADRQTTSKPKSGTPI